MWIIRLQAQDVKYLSRHVPELVHLLQTHSDEYEEPDNAFTDWLLLVSDSIAQGSSTFYLADSSTHSPTGKALEWHLRCGERDRVFGVRLLGST